MSELVLSRIITLPVSLIGTSIALWPNAKQQGGCPEGALPVKDGVNAH